MKLTDHFTCDELDSPDSGECLMDPGFMARLEELRLRVGIEFIVTSGYRTAEYNAAKGGAENGYHQKGLAADISHEKWDGKTKHRFIVQASTMGLSLGVYPKHFHVDGRSGPPVLWVSGYGT